LEGERKQVTVLFADLKGSMELLADRNPEEARKILDPVLELMMEAVHRYEGTVNQVMGDGIMALFGAPVAHEDHAVRACYAALRMQEAVKRYAEEARRAHWVTVRIRVGLNSGDVVVRAIGSDLHMDYTAVGQTTNLAARMEQLADPGAIVVAPTTMTLAEGFVEVRSLGRVPVKGLAEPLEVYEVTGVGQARTRLQATARRGLTPFVGRDAELQQLWRIHQLAGAGRGQVAAVVGEAGVGKSRLFYEFTHSHRLRGWRVLEAASMSYGKATSYLPVIELLKGYFKIHDSDDVRDIREKVTGKVLALDRALEGGLPALLALLDLPVVDAEWSELQPGQRRQQTLDSLKRLLLREAREQPLLVVFEDLHWIDAETQAVLDALVDSLATTSLLLLVNYRPEFKHGWGSKSHYSQLRLDALPATTTAQLLDEMLGDDPALAALKQQLVRRGNPFFLEETVRTLIETGALDGGRGQYRLIQPIQSLQVPPTVQAVLAARIDRLEPEDKRLLQVASVIGKDVSLPLLQDVAGLPEEPLRLGLERLRSAEFLYESAIFPDPEYMFKHALTHEVTYAGLLHERRRMVDARIVQAIERLHADRLAEHVERLAHHAVRGGLGEKAVSYARDAGVKAALRSALTDARAWFEAGLGVLEGLQETTFTLEQGFELRMQLRTLLATVGDLTQLRQCLREADVIAERLEDDVRRATVNIFMINLYMLLGQPAEARAAATRALSIASKRQDLALQVLATAHLNGAVYNEGEYREVVERARQNLRVWQGDWSAAYPTAAPPPIHDRFWLVLSLAHLGAFVEAEEPEMEMIRLAEASQNYWAMGSVWFAAGVLHLFRGYFLKAHSLLARALTECKSRTIITTLRQVIPRHAWVTAELGDGRGVAFAPRWRAAS